MKYLLAVGGVAVVVWAGQVWVARWRRDQPDPALEIKPPTYRYFEGGKR